MTNIEQMARLAGFRKSGETLTCNTSDDSGQILGMDVVSTPLMPEGFFALRTDRGAMIFGPKGAHWVPFWPRAQQGSER